MTSGARNEAFGYACRRCLRCCHDKRIQLNPYEVLRLARRLGQTTTAFRAEYTVGAGGVELERTADGACVFLGRDGCTVHSDRPLVCRLYPLGRITDAAGQEEFRHFEPHPQSDGVYHRDGTIGDYLRAQGAEPFIAASNAYFAWLTAALDVLSQKTGIAPQNLCQEAPDGDKLLDVDASLERYYKENCVAPPTDIESSMALHLLILNRHIEALGDDKHEE
jgi:Fe-S-cluster containining protein